MEWTTHGAEPLLGTPWFRVELANASFFGSDGGARTALHMVTDWPGYFPRGPEIARMLLAAGADPNIPTTGWGPETPLPGRRPATTLPWLKC